MYSKEDKTIDVLKTAFIEVRQKDQKNSQVLTPKGEDGKANPIARLIDTETQCAALEEALNAALTALNYKKGKVSLRHLGGTAIPIFLLSLNETQLIFRILPVGAYIDAYKALQQGPTGKYLPRQYIFNEFQYRNKPQALEVIEFCDKGSLEQKAAIKIDEKTLLFYATSILQIMIDFKQEGVIFPDIKPSNFLVAHDGRLVISDVKTLLGVRGKSQVAKDDVSRTPIYESGKGLMASGSGNVDIAVLDLQSRYMVGVTLYELATGHLVAMELAEKQREALVAKNAALFNYGQAKENNSEQVSVLEAEYEAKKSEFELLAEKRPHVEMNFDHKVFKRGIGPILKTVIESLANKDRGKRISFEEALQHLSLAQSKKKTFLRSASTVASSAEAASPSEVTSPVIPKRVMFKKGRTSSLSHLDDKKIEKAVVIETPAESSQGKQSSPREKTKSKDKERQAFRARTASTSTIEKPFSGKEKHPLASEKHKVHRLSIFQASPESSPRSESPNKERKEDKKDTPRPK